MQLPPRARSFTAKASGRANVLLTDVHISEAFQPEDAHKHSLEKFVAIWDTGATSSVISEKVINKCQLKPIGMTEVHTAAGIYKCNRYLINIGLPNKVAFVNMTVTEGKLTGPADVLIGMDIINKGDFAVTNKDGKTTFSFRLPSIETIDFVKKGKPTVTSSKILKPKPSISRNAPCPCGSGRKYKKCCGK